MLLLLLLLLLLLFPVHKKVIANVAGQNLIQVTFFLHVDSQFSLSPFPKYL